MAYKYLSRDYKDRTSAGNKAKTDNESILQQMGLINVGLPQTISHSTIKHFLMTLAGVLKSPFCLKRGDILVLQYPLKKYYTFVCCMAHMRGAKVITLIHDLGSFRRKALTPDQEIKRLNHSDYIIADNENMKRWIKNAGCRSMLGTLEVWDYLSSTTNHGDHSVDGPYTVVYAGALNRRKNTFLYEWGEYITAYKVRIYGNGFKPEYAKGGADKFEIMGFVKSDDLIATAGGHFGLVWDGDSVDACTGACGEYLRYNTPHKTSLYLRCGLPIIIWKEAAMARFVSENGIGLCIGSLRELDSLLASTTPDDYRRMADNARAVGEKLAGGYYIKAAITEAIEKLNATSHSPV